VADEAAGTGSATDAVVALVRAITTPAWPRDAAEVERMLAGVGVRSTGEVDRWSSGSAQHTLSGGPDAVDHLSYSTHEGEVTSVGLFLARHGGPWDPAVRRDHDDLVAALERSFGPSRPALADQPSPVCWPVGELEVGVQLFDRVDSAVMLWIEHRARSARQERAATGDEMHLEEG
jgi:hypothetical protein